jgi:fermentation-respiration switch protein FrsA (DUF1100 family)
VSELREELITALNHGQRLHGMLHLPKEQTGSVPASLLLHGFTGSSSSDNRALVQQARRLAAHGIAALRFDFRGSGQSEGEFSEMTIAGEAYIEAVSGPRELTEIQGADHSFSSIPWRAKLYAATTDWFRTHL